MLKNLNVYLSLSVSYLYVSAKKLLLLIFAALYILCLLYTSDAADEEDSVDLGGCRLIKKKKEGQVVGVWI